MVKDRVIGNIFGAKEPYYRSSDDHDTARKRFEVLRTEYEYIMQLDHVSQISATILSFKTEYRSANCILFSSIF